VIISHLPSVKDGKGLSSFPLISGKGTIWHLKARTTQERLTAPPFIRRERLHGNAEVVIND
jgi:hypothetical protein